MGSTATFVSKSVSSFALGTCITKPSRSLMARATLACTSRSVVSHTRPFYTRAHEFGSSNFTTTTTTIHITTPFSRKMDFLHFPQAMTMPFPQVYPREIVFLGGAPGAGKGTNSLHVAELRGFDAPTVVVSDLLNTPTCKLLKDHGVMVNDEFVFNALLKELENPIYRNGVVVDGFPRTAKQAEFLTTFYNQTDNAQSPAPRMLFVMLHIDESASINRQQARGREVLTLNEERVSLDLPPLEVRTTDIHVDASKARYAVFKEQLNAVMGLSRQFPLVVVDASSTLDVVRTNLTAQMAMLPESHEMPNFDTFGFPGQILV